MRTIQASALAALAALGGDLAARGQTLSQEFDPNGNLVAVGSFGQVTRYSYDATGRLLGIANPDGTWVAYAYDKRGRLTECRTETGLRQRYRYDLLGGSFEVTFPNGDRQRYLESPDGRHLSVGYPDGTVTRFTLDARARLERVEMDQSRLELHYDARDRLTALVRSDGTAVAFRYDAANRLLGLGTDAGKDPRVWDVSIGVGQGGRSIVIRDPLERMELRRDAAGRPVTVISEWGLKAFIHWDDRTGRVSSATGPWGYLDLDARGRSADILTPQGTRVSAFTDPTGRLERVRVPPLGDIRLAYGRDGLRTVDLGDGFPHEIAQSWRGPAGAIPKASPAWSSPTALGDGGYRFPVPALSAERLLGAEGDRFSSQVSSLILASEKLPLPGTRQALERDAFWTSGKFIATPYYVDLMRPQPLNLLWTARWAVDVSRFGIVFVPEIGPLVGFFADCSLAIASHQLGKMINRVNPNENTSAYERSWRPIHTSAGIVGEVLKIVQNRAAFVTVPVTRTLWLVEEVEHDARAVGRVIEVQYTKYAELIIVNRTGAIRDGKGALKRLGAGWAVEKLATGGADPGSLARQGTGLPTYRPTVGLHSERPPKTGGLDPRLQAKTTDWQAYQVRVDPVSLKVLSAIDLLQVSRNGGAAGREARSGVEILRRALLADPASVSVNHALDKTRQDLLSTCPPSQVTCSGGGLP